jgi:putative membrane-bound dehydrogenase-like protein
MKFSLIFGFACVAGLLAAQDGITTRTTYSKAYGPTNNPVAIDPAKDLPRYPAVEPKDAAATWKVKPGFKLELAASEPQVRDPIAICFDERGRMFVCEMIDYSEMRDVTPHLGRVSVLEDKDGDGFYESASVFADNLPWPTGLIWANGGLFVGATPDIWRFEDRDGDGRAEVREKVFTGFGTGLKILNVQGLMNSFQWGQDGRVHVLAGGGNRGVVSSPKRPDLEGRELGGKDFWFDPVTLDFGLEGGGAQYGMSFDDYGRKFGCSNSVHLQAWLYDDAYAGRNPVQPLPPARSSIAVDGGAAEVFRISPDEPWRIIRTRWRIAGVVKGAVEGGGRVSGYFTGATGTTIYRGDAYGPDFVNNSFTGDAGGQLVHRKVIRYAADGITLEGERPADERGFEFAASTDTWVRVVNFANAPDGCLYVCDMYREVIEHPWSVPDEIKQHLDLNSGNDRGRIWRLVPEGSRPERIGQKVDLVAADNGELLRLLGHANGWHRDTAHRLLTERLSAGQKLPQEGEAPANAAGRLHWLALREASGQLDDRVLGDALADADAQVRERACRLLERRLQAGLSAELRPQLIALADADPSPRVRFQALLSLGGLAGAESDAELARVFARASADANATLRAAALGAEPALVAAALQQRLQNGLDDVDSLPPLIETAAARKDAKDGSRLAAVIAEAPAVAQGPLLRAFAAGLRRAGKTLAAVDADGRLAAVFDRAATTATDAAATEPARVAALELLSLASRNQAAPAFEACLRAGQGEAVQTAAVRSYAALAGDAVSAPLLAAWADLKPAARTAALALLLAREKGITAFLNAVEAGSIQPQELAASQVQDLLKHKNADLVTRAKSVLKAVIPPSRAEVAATYAPAVGMKGDARAGQNHYIGRCMACHRAQGLGVEVGPDLVTVKTKGREALLSAILDPHKEVASQFIAYTFQTKDGQTLSGLIAEDEASSVTLKMMGGAVATLARSNIQGSSSAGLSLMPEGLEAGMSIQDMADLLSFIEELP